VEWGRAQEVREPELVSYYKNAFERVYDYCQTFGVKCVYNLKPNKKQTNLKPNKKQTK